VLNDKSRNQTSQPILGIHQFIERHALLTPHAPAVTCDGKTFTYKELNDRSNQLANFLIKKGISVETFVGVSLKQSVEVIITIIGILKTGGTYVPIDPNYPKERINYMLSDSRAKILVTHHSLFKHIPDLKIDKICLETNHEEICTSSKENPTVPINPTNLAYVIYTSGSTGTPKGVMVSHSNLINAYHAWKEVYDLSNADCHLQMASFSFDVFSGDLIRALCSGGKLVLCPKDILLAPEELYNLIVDQKINCAEFIPTILRRLIKYVESSHKSLNFMRLLICGSDTWSISEYRKSQRLCGKETRVINSYGLTETTIDSTYFEDKLPFNKHLLLNHNVPIGKPFPNTEVFLLDEKSSLVPCGKIGEIHIGGKGLSRGYLNNPELTAKKFISHPFSKLPNTKLYKTGDLGRYLPDGNLEFLGRMDTQVKLNGIRIELSDIENILNSYKPIKDSVAVLSEDESQYKRLMAYLVLEGNAKLNIREVRHFLQDHLPHHMIPSIFIRLDSLPITPNGKVNRQALKEKAALSLTDNYVEPRTPVERQLASAWKKLLHTNTVGIFDHFFDLGGDSILFAQLAHLIESDFFVNIEMDKFPKDLTIASIAQLINQTIHSENKEIESV